MATYYLDKNFRIHLEPEENFLSWEDEEGFFDSKNSAFIEGYRVIPEGKKWVDKNGTIYSGLIITAAVEYPILYRAQLEKEQAESIIAELDAALLDTTYINIINSIE